MNRFYKIGSVIILMFLSLSMYANELVYKWKAGAVYRFHAIQTDDISTTINMMGMNQAIHDIYKTDIIFALKVKSVSSTGTADAIIYVEQFKVTNKAGHVVASLAGIPKEALSSPVEVDKKGNFQYKKIVYMIVQDNAKLLVTGKAENNKVAATATYPDGTQLSVNAEFDPKTGTLKAGYSATNVGKPVEKRVAVKENATELDILPYDFLAVFKLPDGEVKAGQTVTAETNGMKMTMKTDSYLNNVAMMSCNFDMNTKDMNNGVQSGNQNMKINSNPGGDNQGMNMGDMNGMDMNMNMDMNMGDMNQPDNSGMPQGGSTMPETKTDGTIKVTFDNNLGIFKLLTGTINSTTKSTGMNLVTKSNVTLKAL